MMTVASIVHFCTTANELNNRSSKVFQYYSHHLDLFVFWFANPALSYYTRLDNLTIPKKRTQFRHDLTTLSDQMKKLVCHKNWVFAASHPAGDWDKQLQDMIYALDKDTKVHKDKGAILLEFNRQEN